jgi:hypothetical protein
MSSSAVVVFSFLSFTVGAAARAAGVEATPVELLPLRVGTADIQPQLRGQMDAAQVALVVVWGSEPRVTLEASDDVLLKKLEGGTVTLETSHRPGEFRTKAFSGERWKCVEGENGKWVTRDNDDLVQIRLPVRIVAKQEDAPRENEESVSAWRGVAKLPDGTAVLRLSLPVQFWRMMPPVSVPVTHAVIVRVSVSHKASWVFRVPLDKPFTVPAAVEEMFRQYQKNGPVAARSTRANWTFSLVRKDLCGDGVVSTIDFSQIDLLAFPTPEWRLSHKAGWLFADRVPLPRTGPVEPIRLWEIPTTQMTFLGEKYDVSLMSVDVHDGAAVATFETGDFSGCFGASCGDPVNVKRVVVTLKDGKLASKVTKKE